MPPNKKYNSNGNVAIRIVLITISFLLLSAALVSYLRINRMNQDNSQRKAIALAELGLQNALSTLSVDPAWRSGIPSTLGDGGSYMVTISEQTRNDSIFIAIESKGSCNRIHRVSSCILTRAGTEPDSVWHRFAQK